MDCVMIDRESFERLKTQCETFEIRSEELEKENDAIRNCNKLMHKLVDALENIKFNLEKTVELMRMNYNISEQFLPFERECLVWHEEYCNMKCMLTQLEDIYDDNNADCSIVFDGSQSLSDEFMTNNESNEDNSEEVVISRHMIDDIEDNMDNEDNEQNNEEDVDESGEQFDDNSGNNEQKVLTVEMWNENDANATVSEYGTDANESHVFAISESDLTNIANQCSEQKPKAKRNRKPFLTEAVMVSTTPGTKRFNCRWDGCTYATNSSGNFQKHYRIHTGEKPYKCEFSGCTYSCSDPGSIKEHRRIHSMEKEFKCDWPGCTWRFSTYKLLRNHTRACHTGEKPHKCDWPGCEKSFLAPYALRTHKLKHTGDRPFKCDITGCKGAFTRSTDLLRHKRETHSTEKQYRCEYEDCSSRFYRKDDLKHHVRRKHEFPTFGRKTSKAGRPSKRIVKKEREEEIENENEEATDEPKVVIDLNVAKVNQLKKSIQINFV